MIDIVVHSFRMGDVEDPDLYAADPLWQWQESEQGQWIMQHAVGPPTWHRSVDHTSYGHKFVITATLKEPDCLFYKLKWGDS